MEGTFPKGYEPNIPIKKRSKDHSGRNELLLILGVAFAFVLAFGYFSGMFAWFHDMGLEIDQNKARINSQVQAETSCNNLKTFDAQWDGYWNKPYVVQQVEQRMVELKC